VINILLGIAVIALGLFAIKKPESWWFKRIGEDSEPSDANISLTRFGGVVTLIMGLIIFIISTLNIIL
jgi:hypothetical protein